MFGLLYHKHNPLITTVVYKATFLKHLRLLGENHWEKNIRRYYFCSGITTSKL